MNIINKFIGLSLLLGVHSICLADEAKEMFSLFDLDANNAISFDEFYIAMMREEGEEIYQEFLSGDDDKNGIISFEEASEFDATREEYQQADKDNNGQVDLAEFISVVLRDLFDEADVNHDNVMVFSEFKKVVDEDE